jgi:hypothetical protein
MNRTPPYYIRSDSRRLHVILLLALAVINLYYPSWNSKLIVAILAGFCYFSFDILMDIYLEITKLRILLESKEPRNKS